MNSFMKKSSTIVLLAILCTQSMVAMDGKLLQSILAARAGAAHALPEDEHKEAEDMCVARERSADPERDTGATIVLSNGVREQIDLARIECPIACDNFQNLFASLAPADHLILSRVVTCNRAEGKEFVHYYNGLASREAFSRKNKNPMNGLVPQSIDYFRYNAVGKEFNLLCSHAQLRAAAQDSYLVSFFNVQDNGNLAHKAFLQFILGSMYYEGKSVQADYKQAITYLHAARDSKLIAPTNQALVNILLGLIYCTGCVDLQKDYKQAHSFLKEALDSTYLDLKCESLAQLKLGEMYCDGSIAVGKDYKQASIYLKKALNSKVLKLQDQAVAQFGLGIIFYEGDASIETNYEQANLYLQTALDSKKLDLESQALAQLILGQIHCEGDENMKKDYKKGHIYLKTALASGLLDPNNQAIAQYYCTVISAILVDNAADSEAKSV